MQHQLTGKKILVLVSNGVDETVMSVVQRELLKTGATVKTVGTEPGLVNSWNSTNNSWGLYFPVDQQISQTLGADFDCVVVPSGGRSVLKLATNPHSERILSGFILTKKPMVFIGDAVDLPGKINLAEAVKGANVLTGDPANITGFVPVMIEYFANMPADLPVAA